MQEPLQPTIAIPFPQNTQRCYTSIDRKHDHSIEDCVSDSAYESMRKPVNTMTTNHAWRKNQKDMCPQAKTSKINIRGGQPCRNLASPAAPKHTCLLELLCFSIGRKLILQQLRKIFLSKLTFSLSVKVVDTALAPADENLNTSGSRNRPCSLWQEIQCFVFSPKLWFSWISFVCEHAYQSVQYVLEPCDPALFEIMSSRFDISYLKLGRPFTWETARP